MTDNLSWLSDVKPAKTEFRRTPRGRQPGKNPVAQFVKQSFDENAALTLPTPAVHAHKIERLLRRAGVAQGVSLSVQVLTADPALETTGGDDVIALKEIKDLPEGTDVWVSFHATKKTEAEKKADTTPAAGDENADATPAAAPAPAVADPFAGTPLVSNPTPAEDAPANGRKGVKAGSKK